MSLMMMILLCCLPFFCVSPLFLLLFSYSICLLLPYAYLFAACLLAVRSLVVCFPVVCLLVVLLFVLLLVLPAVLRLLMMMMMLLLCV